MVEWRLIIAAEYSAWLVKWREQRNTSEIIDLNACLESTWCKKSDLNIEDDNCDNEEGNKNID